MTWLLLALGFFLLLSGILGQAYSLKTKRGVLPPESRIWRVLTRLTLFLAGLLLIAIGGGADRSPSWGHSLTTLRIDRGFFSKRRRGLGPQPDHF